MIRGLNKISKILGLFYKDSLTVYRTKEVLMADMSTKTVTSPVPELSNISCRVDIKTNDSQDEAEKTSFSSPINIIDRIFTMPSIKLLSGDTCVIDIYNENGIKINTIKGLLGESVVYGTHQETLLTINEVS